ncbi:MAG: hypothetical protein HOM21_06585, partial [Halobacteriovoraceae bacterium]|nr:hypothetical protein [Halobacteriovoraceae bacterium]
MKKTIGLLAFLLLSSNLYAGNFQLDNISQSEVDDLTRELAADWIFTTVSSPKMTGDLIPGFGLEIGVVAGITEAPTWEKLIKEEDPDTDIDKLPYLNL